MKSAQSSGSSLNYNFWDFLTFSFINTFIDKPLHKAAKEGNLDKLRQILNLSIDLNEFDDMGYTPLHYAVKHGRIECVRLLLEKGADPNILTNNSTKRTPLHQAIYNKQKMIIKLLIQNGADFSTIKDYDGNTAYMLSKQIEGMSTYFEEVIKEQNSLRVLREKHASKKYQSMQKKLL